MGILQLINYLLLIIYQTVSWLVGYRVISKSQVEIPVLLRIVGAFLIGLLLTIPITYLASSYVYNTTEVPFLWSVISTIGVATTWLLLVKGTRQKKIAHKNNYERITRNEVAIVIFSITVATWIAFKSFHGGVNGEIYVGSNNVFDFSHALGLIRSFSWGDNVPFTSPFQSGLQFFYHFFFYYWTALWEYFGVPIVWAVNIVSILSFSSLLIIIYYMPNMLFHKTSWTGWVAVLLTLTNSTLTWLQLLMKKGLSVETIKSLWTMQTYPFAGPFDGSIISLFMTLNNYVNQRHLAFGIAASLFLVVMIARLMEQKLLTLSRAIGYGILFGLLGMWNIAITVLATLATFFMLLFGKLRKQSFIFGVVAASVVTVSYSRYLLQMQDFLAFGAVMTGGAVPIKETWNASLYFLMNLGIIPLIACIGYRTISKNQRVYGRSFLLFAFLLCLLSVFQKKGFDQKFLSFLIIWVNIFAAIGVVWIWQKRTNVARSIAFIIFFLLTVSGCIDLLPIKNEFAYPLVDSKMLPVISWVHKNTSKQAVFVSYADMIDPVVFAGRKNYFGFFGNMGWIDRSNDVKNIYLGDVTLAQKLGISYVLVPRWEKNDFPYIVDIMYFTEHNMLVYEDEQYSIYQTTRR